MPHVSRELMLVKVSCTAQQRGELVSLASVSGEGGWLAAGSRQGQLGPGVGCQSCSPWHCCSTICPA